MRNGPIFTGYLEVVKVWCDSLDGGRGGLHKVCHSPRVVFLQMLLNPEGANRARVRHTLVKTGKPPTVTLTTSCNLWCRAGRIFWKMKRVLVCGWGWYRRLWPCLLLLLQRIPQQRHWLQSRSHRSHHSFWSPSAQKRWVNKTRLLTKLKTICLNISIIQALVASLWVRNISWEKKTATLMIYNSQLTFPTTS